MRGCVRWCSGRGRPQLHGGRNGGHHAPCAMRHARVCRAGLNPKEAPSEPFNTYTVTTSGIQLTEVACPKGTPHIKSVMLR
jgi:hypothetical protein